MVLGTNEKMADFAPSGVWKKVPIIGGNQNIVGCAL